MRTADTGIAVGRYLVDKSVSRFTVRAFAHGLLSALGHNPTIAIRDFTAEAEFDPERPEHASLRVRIRADSLEVTDDIKSGDRREMESTMKQKVLETAKYPEIAFDSAGASAVVEPDGRCQITMRGNLSLHGVTRSFPVTARISPGGSLLRAFGEFSILQSDYGIAPVSVAGGALKLKDELKLAFDLVARKQE